MKERGSIILVTLPALFWILYYLFLICTFILATFNVVKGKLRKLSITAILFSVLVPLITLINSMGRVEGKNEFEHLVSQLQQGTVWSMFTTAGYLFLLVWWGIFIFNKNNVK